MINTISDKDLIKIRDILQNVLKIERNMADTLFKAYNIQPEGFYNVSSEEMSDKWNKHMNFFVAILFELTKRHYSDELTSAHDIKLL